jgi:energy-converting hydrogenase B subunit Q
MDANKHGLLIEAGSGPGVLHQVTGVMAEHDGDIGSVSILENSPEGSRVYFEVTTPAGKKCSTGCANCRWFGAWKW